MTLSILRIPVLLLLLLFSMNVVQAQDSTDVVIPKIYVKAFQGVETPLEHAKVKLVEVLEDSRCPKNVQCVWAGQAKVVVEISINGNNRREEIIINPGVVNSIDLNNGLTLNIKGLGPYPETSSKTASKDYYLLIKPINN